VYSYRLIPIDLEAWFSTLRVYDPSSFLNSQLGGVPGGVMVRQQSGSPFFRPFFSPGPSVGVAVPVSSRMIDDTGERRRIVDTVLRSLAYLESARLIKGNTAEVVLMAEWRYGYTTHHLRYSYVGAWGLGSCGPEDVHADGGLSKQGEEVVLAKGRLKATGGLELSDVCIPRVPFQDVKPKNQLSPAVYFTPPRVDEENYLLGVPWIEPVSDSSTSR
jgi:hypothetical protein